MTNICPVLNIVKFIDSTNSSKSLVWHMTIFYQTYCTRRNSHQRFSIKKGVPKNYTKFTSKHLCHCLFFNNAAVLRSATFWKKKTLTQVFSCEFCKILKNTFFTEHFCFCTRFGAITITFRDRRVIQIPMLVLRNISVTLLGLVQ